MAEKPRDWAETEENVYVKGYLHKRQRGKHIKKENQRKKLKFQERFCVLNKDFFLYRKKENSKVRGSFPVEKIKIVHNTNAKTFRKGTVANPDLCFQIGDEGEMLYLRAPNEEKKKEWMEAFKRAALDKGNVMMQFYHSGAYGSKVDGKWSCCDQSGYQATACTSVSQERDSELSNTFNSTASNETDSATTCSLQYSSSCYSNTSSDLFETHLVPVKFDDSDHPSSTTGIRSRTNTGESGIEVNPNNTKRDRSRNTLPSISSSETEHELGCYSSEDSVYGDEGIESDVQRKCKLATADKDSEVKVGHENDKKLQTFNESFHLTSTHKLPHPLTTLAVNHNSLITGNDNMLQVWDTTVEVSLKHALNVAGKATSLDTWDDYIAVGSSVVQLILLKPANEPKRILYARGTDSLKLQSASESNTSHLVAFLGENGDLASASIGGKTIDIWDPPPTDSQVVLDSKSSITTDNNTILCLAASKDPRHPWVAAMTEGNGSVKFYTIHWKDALIHKSVDLFDSDFRTLSLNRSISLPQICHVSETFFVVGNELTLTLLDGHAGSIIDSIMIEDSISCISHTKDNILVGTKNGEIKVFTDDIHREILHLSDKQIGTEVVAIDCDADYASMYVARSNGVFEVWKYNPTELTGSKNFEECLVGMQLCSEGILSQRRLYHLNNEESLSISSENEDFHLQLPHEALSLPNPSLELAFAPFGPVGPHFIFPDGMIPVSPAVWICFSPSKEFLNPAILKLPHCFECTSAEDLNSICFLKANHKSITKDERGQSVIKFEKVDKSQSEFYPHYGLLREQHFCMYCLAVEERGKDGSVLGKVNYCLTILKPKSYPTNETRRIYCLLHFDLEGCKQLVKEQTPDDYDSDKKLLQFDTSRCESIYLTLKMQILKMKAEEHEWAITVESERKIYAEDVNFFKYLHTKYLVTACDKKNFHKAYPFAYPPKFVLEVSSRNAQKDSDIELRFTGAQRELTTEIQLNLVRTEQDLNSKRSSEDDHQSIPPATKPFNENGFWPREEHND